MTTILSHFYIKIFKRPLHLNLHSNRSKFGKYSIVQPAEVSDLRLVPDHIQKPHYYELGDVKRTLGSVHIKNEAEIESMRKSCKLAATILKNSEKIVQVGTTTNDIDKFVHDQCIENGAYPSPFWYKFFPKSVCTSVNNVAAHGIPDSRPLEDGDIINVDITVFLNGFHGDCSKTYQVGKVDDKGKELIGVTTECLAKGISICGPGVPFSEIGFAIQKHAEMRNYTVFPAFLGHGIGLRFHEPPDIYHVRNSYPGTMKKGMTFTIEPIVTPGDELVELLEDQWTVVTADGARAAQEEHTILITDDGCDILTK